MVSKVYEHFRVFVRFEGRAVAIVTQEDVIEVLCRHLAAGVVNFALVINVDAWSASFRRFVEDLARVRVVPGVSDIVVRHVNDILSSDAVRQHNLDGMVSVSLMAVVAIGVRARHNDGPVRLRRGRERSESSGSSESLHNLQSEDGILLWYL